MFLRQAVTRACFVALLLSPTLAWAQSAAEVKVHAIAMSKAFRQAAEAATPAVVTIVAKQKVSRQAGGELPDIFRDPRFKELFPDGRVPFDLPPPRGQREAIPQPEAPESAPGDEGQGEDELEGGVGSGVIIEASGLVLTNNHVVEDSDSVVVRLHDGREFPAENIRTDPLSDLAVLQIKGAGNLTAAKLGDSEKLEIGDWVIAIGSPFELEATVSAGIISGKGRTIGQIRRGQLLQTDAAINPGNSGGPLVNLDGEVVGINTAIATVSGGYQGIGFAIPIDRARWVARELTQQGKVRRAYLGIRIEESTQAVARRLSIAVQSGVVVVDVVANSPAGEAGMQAGDVITEFAGKRVRNPRELQEIVEQQPFGSRCEAKVLRASKTQSLQVAVKPLPEDFEQSFPARPRP